MYCPIMVKMFELRNRGQRFTNDLKSYHQFDLLARAAQRKQNARLPRVCDALCALYASLALLISVITITRLWQAVSAYQPIWLFPGLYFLEMVVASILGWLAIVPTRELSSGQITIVN